MKRKVTVSQLLKTQEAINAAIDKKIQKLNTAALNSLEKRK